MLAKPVQLDLGTYRERAAAFLEALQREYYRHLSGRKEELEIGPIYDEHAELFTLPAVEQLRRNVAAQEGGDERRSARYLLQFAAEGLLGQRTKAEESELARREASLVLDLDGGVPYRQSSILQANEADTERRATIEAARMEALEQELNPLHRAVLESSHALARELGYGSYRAMMEELKGVDLVALERQTAAFVAATDDAYPGLLEPQLREQTGLELAQLRASDLPYFFRAAGFDDAFPAAELIARFEQTMAGLGIDVPAQQNVIVDAEPRPLKSPRAFCTPAQVPQEVYLVVPRVGGRDDYSALFHEGGHTEHYAHVDGALPWEFRTLGDNSVTECFAFLFDHLTENEEWLRRRLGLADPAALAAYARANKLVYLRRYAAKLAYELGLHADGVDLQAQRSRYAELLGAAVGVEWPPARFLSDVDPGFYCANYLRAWALEAKLRREMTERFGETWFEQGEAGAFLKGLWSQGQRLDADELATEVTGSGLDFGVMVDEALGA